MTSEQQEVVQQIVSEVRTKLEGEGSGHDWWHIARVWRMAQRLVAHEGGDAFVVELAALLHDIADWKFYDGDESVGPRIAREMLESHSVPEDVIAKVCDVIAHISFKGAGVINEIATLEGMIVQDADRLDAIGAIGVARAFAYGGNKNRALYDPEHKPALHQTKEEYFKNQGTSVNHFYEKLLLLKDRLNTETAKKLALDRHRFMEQFLEEFYREWEGEG